MSNLQMRIITAAFLIIISLSATWAGGILFRAFILIIGALIYHEWQILTAPHNNILLRVSGWLVYLGLAGLLLLDHSAQAVCLSLLAAVVILGLLNRLLIGWQGGGWLAGGLLYALAAPITLAFIRDEAAGLSGVLFLYAVVWATDSAAYFSGRALGGAKLAPKISPNKTWSGAIGGALAACVAGLVIVWLRPDLGFSLPLALMTAFVLCVISQIGDIGESWLKRHFHAKDSGTFLPGHGGFMDRADGLIAASVAFYLLNGVLASI